VGYSWKPKRKVKEIPEGGEKKKKVIDLKQLARNYVRTHALLGFILRAVATRTVS